MLTSKDDTTADSHLLPLDGSWSLWRPICLRGAGFPVRLLDRLAAPETARAVDRFLALTAAFEEARRDAEGHCLQARKNAPKGGRTPWNKALRHLAKGRTPEPVPGDRGTADLFDAVRALKGQVNEAEDRARTAFEADASRTTAALVGLCRQPLFREALAWQNLGVLPGAIDRLIERADSMSPRELRGAKTVAGSYLQRYCAKNDTIGFFGPAGWARWAEDGGPIDMHPGPTLVEKRWAWLEHWGVECLAETLRDDPALRRWLAPRLVAGCRVEGEHAVDAVGNRVQLSPPAVAAVARACDGRTPALTLAADIAKQGLAPAEWVMSCLEQLAGKGMVVWDAALPVHQDAFDRLRRTVDAIDDADVRARGLAPLDRIAESLEALRTAGGDAAAVERGIADLETRFEAITGEASRRHHGLTYKGRTLVYEDCRRDMDLSFGPEVRERLGPPLGLILDSARWYAGCIGQALSHEIAQVYDQLAARSRDGAVPIAALPLFDQRYVSRAQAIFEAVGTELERRWADILQPSPSVRAMHFSSADLRPAVDERFPALALPWPSARYQSPDVMIAANGEESFRRGEFRFVLGELHVAGNTMAGPALAHTYPDADAFNAMMAADMGRPLVHSVIPRDHDGIRVAPGSISAADYEVETGDTPGWRPPGQRLRIDDLVVVREPDGLHVRSRDGRRRFRLDEFFRQRFGYGKWRNFRLLEPADHRPRLTIDDLVVAREQWTVPLADVPFPQGRSEWERFVSARRWRAAMGMPRCVFFKVPWEIKPVYLDLDSPLSVQIAVRTLRDAPESPIPPTVSFTEMMPSPEECWLADAEGNRYTAELRLAAVDSIAYGQRVPPPTT